MGASAAASDTEDSGPGGARRPGGRSARVQQAVYSAVGELVGRGHRDTMTIPQVAEIAGVNPTSIYRRWGSITALLEEVAVAVLTRGEDIPDTGTLRGDLDAWATIIGADITRPRRRAYLRALVNSRDEPVELCPCWEIRRAQAETMVERARVRGEAAPTVTAILCHIIAPLYHHAVFGLPIDDEFAAGLAEDTMRMALDG
ncbi:TetR/AcrR family transcriptional regulator [Gordonia sp. NB41Y]|uniref:TetR/AcrR family transcriptional regulator n=1 Tax=Gordonia sp. NB41Y TaxID=875808 RepID=UPI0006B1BC1F|nr:TetR/AcrR family transcriptional regulator [Gordonia sp. NB41Y]EMP11823.2 TetR family transcriptional regulator [Gordonia sp. NB41Y]WLP92341.1 TetR/AcrR family transcriptional regulator C-terminal ligand-binding domain-containing protein [Gordonia sp. NB41Y]